MLTETRNITMDECEKTIPEVKWKERSRRMIEDILKIDKDK